MLAARSVPWWKRLLLAFVATLVANLLYTTACCILSLPGSLDHKAHPIRSELQTAFLLFALGGYYVALPCFFLIAAPLALLVPVRLQLRYWYGILLAAIIPFVLLQNFLGTPNLAILREKIHTIRWYQEVIAALIPASPCALYLWLLRNQAKKPQAFKS